MCQIKGRAQHHHTSRHSSSTSLGTLMSNFHSACMDCAAIVGRFVRHWRAMLKAHKIRLNPTPEQELYFKRACGVARFCYNWGLAEWKRQYEAGGKPSAYELKKQFNAIRREQFPWTYDVTKCAVDTGFLNLGAAFENFFCRVANDATRKGYPRFKRRGTVVHLSGLTANGSS